MLNAVTSVGNLFSQLLKRPIYLYLNRPRRGLPHDICLPSRLQAWLVGYALDA